MPAHPIRAHAIIAFALLMLPAVSLADNEVGGDSSPPPMTSSLMLHDLDTQLHVSIARFIITDEDMGDQYDGMWLPGLEVSFAMTRQSRFFLSGHYGSMTGDPFADDPTFTGGESRLRALPLRSGIRLDTAANTALKVHWTAGVQIVWVSEEAPIYGWDGSQLLEEPSGWTSGMFFGVAPEVLWNEGRRSLRLEFGWNGSGARIGSGPRSHDISLTGIWLALGTTINL